MPPKAILDRCARLNPHGFGFATKDRVFKTLDYNEFRRDVAKIDSLETVILHFRYATHGSIKLENCHPFRDEKTGVSFAHNGILDIKPIDDMTDSETAFRTRIVPALRECGFQSSRFISENYQIIGGSRFAYIDNRGEYRLYGTFTQYRGCWYSNRNFLPFSEQLKYYYAR